MLFSIVTQLRLTHFIKLPAAGNLRLYYTEDDLMKKSYMNSRVVPVWFDDATVARLNEMALQLEMPRNKIVRRMLELMLADIDAGRELYPNEGCN